MNKKFRKNQLVKIKDPICPNRIAKVEKVGKPISGVQWYVLKLTKIFEGRPRPWIISLPEDRLEKVRIPKKRSDSFNFEMTIDELAS